MKVKLLILIASLFMFTGCYVFIEPGHEAVKVMVAGSNTGDQEVLPAGRYFNTYRTQYYRFPIFEQTAQFRGSEAFEFTVEGLKVGMEIGISYRIIDTNTMFRRYRVGVEEVTNVHLRNIVRDALNTETRSMSMEGIYGEESNRMMERVFSRVNDIIEPIGIQMTGIYMIGRPSFPAEVERAIERRINATQLAEQREIERREAIAQAEIERERARGEADARLIRAESQAQANRLISASLTSILVRSEAIGKWDGIMPKYTGGGAVPFIDIN
jgi:regulator of protease activity HflC (stomatin/prohibitin superfamily)